MYKHTFYIDYETRSGADLRSNDKVGLHKYVRDPEFKILICCYAIDDGPVQKINMNDPSEVAWLKEKLQDSAYLKSAANAFFEMECSEVFFGITIYPEQWRCTLAMAYTLGLSGGLDQISRILRVGVKITEGKNYISFFSKPRKETKHNKARWNAPEDYPEEFKGFEYYCGIDVELERKCAKCLLSFLQPSFERDLWILDYQINKRGFLCDPHFVQNALRFNQVFLERTLNEIIQITGINNAKSVAQIKKWLSEELSEELETEVVVKSLSKESIPKIIKLTSDTDIHRVLRLRELTSKASTTKYAAMQRNWLDDYRVRGLLQYYGAQRTGRWAGRLVQSHNLPKTEMKDLDYARKLVSEGAMEFLDCMYKSIPFALSQLIRTAFVAGPGKELLISDFSAIEARVLAWLAGEQWRLDVFKTHGKIYEASASFMFNIPIEEVDEELRQSGKVAELALGYGGALGALKQMLKSARITAYELDKPFNFNPTDEQLEDIKNRWREANPNICLFWWACNEAALEAVNNPGQLVTDTTVYFKGELRYYKMPYGISFQVKNNVLFITLPSGRKLCYLRPQVGEGKYGPCVTYEGNEKGTGSWGRVETYGGKIVENCLAADTKVLTLRGWINIVNVSNNDLLWDGINWVSHNGLIEKGIKTTIDVSGVRMTEDHKILTNEGWKNASQSEGLKRPNFQLPNSDRLRRIGRKKIAISREMHLRQKSYNSRFRAAKVKNKIMRMHEIAVNRKSQYYAQHVQSPSLLGMEIDDRSVQTSYASSLEKLRRPGYKSVQTLADIFEILGGYGSNLQRRSNYRKKKSKPKLHSKKLSLGNNESSNEKQKIQCTRRYEMGKYYRLRISRKNRYLRRYSLLQDSPRVPLGTFNVCTGCTEQVYDIKNAGPLHRFTVLGCDGPFIVHNCVQAISRDILAMAMLRLDKAGFNLVMHVHDEVICEETENAFDIDQLNDLMKVVPDWAPGLPLNVKSFQTKYYKKD